MFSGSIDPKWIKCAKYLLSRTLNQRAFTCLKSKIETPEQYLKSV